MTPFMKSFANRHAGSRSGSMPFMWYGSYAFCWSQSWSRSYTKSWAWSRWHQQTNSSAWMAKAFDNR
jgi:hypothetical protein